MKRVAGLAKLIAGGWLVMVLGTASAQTAQIEFSLASDIGGPASGWGYVLTPSTSLTPGTFTTDPDALLGMYMYIEGIPERFGPTATAFQKPSLAAAIPWLLEVDSTGQIFDLNFFGRDGTVNADGYSVEGFSPLSFWLCDGPAFPLECAGGQAASIDNLQVTITAVSILPAVPEPPALLLMLAGLAILVRMRSSPRAGARIAT